MVFRKEFGRNSNRNHIRYSEKNLEEIQKEFTEGIQKRNWKVFRKEFGRNFRRILRKYSERIRKEFKKNS